MCFEGELTLIEDGGETLLRAGDCAAFPKGTGNGHHMINRSGAVAVYLEVGSRQPDDLTTCSDIDMMSANPTAGSSTRTARPTPSKALESGKHDTWSRRRGFSLPGRDEHPEA